ncbi:ABC transporter permease [Conexibacter stalactiti]|uniref:ABC transporter permease n=1 Tax=Conexibacter stalactiti TaxID=1940611 RepID=A0ABU4HR75_9ACTN|nr:ABC transporter permease [Conexibacter stalactiti]MDW5595795.1 ABC transporter permease [Conexibacter stalactiti]MEC5036437.1 ABC transporter permease [Conexibacter stalactiti]
MTRLSNYTGLYIWAALIALFALWVPDTFLTQLTAQTLASEQAVTAIVAIGLLVPLAAGAYDLSVGGMVGLSAIVVSALTARAGMPLAPAIALTLALGAAIGAINGFLVVGVGINSFIATLAMGSVLVAPARAVSDDQIIAGVPRSLTGMTEGTVLGIPAIALYMLFVAVVVWYVLEHTPTGRRVEATGAGPDAARLAGVRTGRMVFGSLVTSALLASVAGILLASKLSTATPDLGPAYLLPAFAAAFLGTTQIKPGKFNVWGTLLAIFLLATGVKGLQLAGAADWVTDLFNGLALILAVGLSLWGARVLLLFKRPKETT